jgi:UDP-N-acetylglucosamine:LPS N-acetylglucosamine transferase
VTVRRSLILSGSLGKGHDVVGEACAAALGARGVESRMLDSVGLMGQSSGAVGDRVFRALLSSPPVYDAFHFTQLRGDGALGHLAERAALARLSPNLRGEVDGFGADLVISVFATGAGAAARLKRDERPDLSTVVVMTDSYAHRMWVHEGTDLFLVTSTLAAASVRRYLPRATVAVLRAPPVRPAFAAVPTRAVARRALGVPDDAACVLLMSGALGIGPLDSAAAALARAGYWVLAVAGNNLRLQRRLSAQAGRHPSIVALGYTDRIPELMAACDVVVTSSGDTCREARVVGRGLVLLDVVPGHGRENLMHELELGHAAVCTPTAAGVVAAVDAFLDDDELRTVPPEPTTGFDDELGAALASAGIKLP